MPEYTWICTRCQAAATTINSIHEHDKVPGGSDIPSEAPTDCEHKWVKTFLKAPSKVYGRNWNTRKGYH